MKKVLLVILAVLMPVLVSAQTVPPCEQQPPTVYRYTSGQLKQLKVGFCHDNLDNDGNPIQEPIGFKMEIDGVGIYDLGYLRPIYGPDANGEYYYEFRTNALAAGTIHFHAYTKTGESTASEAVTLTLIGKPKPPTGGVVIIKPGE